MRLRAWIYSAAHRGLQKTVPQLKDRAFRFEATAASASQPGARRAWFHAASYGELESLWTVIDAFVREGGQVCLSVFSPSGRKRLEQLVGSLEDAREDAREDAGRNVIYAGYSPWEGDWNRALRECRPDIFITAKYEAWPGLWAALSEERIPLVIVGARMRGSLRWAKRICGLLGARLPRMTLLTADPGDEAELRAAFPDARIAFTGDPRWDRVRSRLSGPSPRVKELTEAFAALPRPWGIFGSAWPEDLAFWGDQLSGVGGTFWVVPHDLKQSEKIRQWLENRGISVVVSSNWRPGSSLGARAVLVNEVGFLSELYRVANWAFVGGGFGAGIHSTIEPAIHGIPIAAGPSRYEKFPEAQLLERIGQLKVVRSPADLQQWLSGLVRSAERKEAWKAAVERQFGSTGRVLGGIRDASGVFRDPMAK